MKLIGGFILFLLQIVVAIPLAIIGVVTGKLKENGERGKTFGRAYAFLEALESGVLDEEAANRAAGFRFEPESDAAADNRCLRRGLNYVKQAYGGNQLALIEHARSKGFKG